jgi:hypothetical protein
MDPLGLEGVGHVMQSAVPPQAAILFLTKTDDADGDHQIRDLRPRSSARRLCAARRRRAWCLYVGRFGSADRGALAPDRRHLRHFGWGDERCSFGRRSRRWRGGGCARRLGKLLAQRLSIAGFLPWSREDRLVHHPPEIGPDALVCRVTGQAPEWLGRRLIRVGPLDPIARLPRAAWGRQG